MKKFGTPTAAGPGVASEVVGFVGAGLPLGRVRGRVRTGVVVEVLVAVPASGWTGLHPLLELEVLLMQPAAPVEFPPWRRLRERARRACLASVVAVAVGAVVASAAGGVVASAAGGAVASVVGAAVAVLSAGWVAVGELTTVSTGDAKGVGVLSSAGALVAALVASGAGESAAGAVVGLDVAVGSWAPAPAPRSAA